MRLSLLHLLVSSVFLMALSAYHIQGQALDQGLVPRGHLRLQAQPIYTTWDSRFNQASDGSERIEKLGDDLSSHNGANLFPDLEILQSSLRELMEAPNYEPSLGPTTGRVQQEMTSIKFAAEVGVSEWLTVGVLMPWNQTRTVIDLIHTPDTLNADLGLNPTIQDPSAVQSFLSSINSASSDAQARATEICAGGANASCVSALELAARASAFESAISSAYTATAFFPLAGSNTGSQLTQILAELNTALSTANLSSILPLVLAQTTLSSGDFAMMAVTPESGIGAVSPVQSRRGLWGPGDVEVSAKLRLADNMTYPEVLDDPGIAYRVTGRVGVRLPTGTPESPDVLLDIGTGDGQLDLEAGLAAELRVNGRFGIATSGSLVSQRPTTLVRRVARRSQAMPASRTRAEVRWDPGRLVGIEISPYLRISSVLSIHGEYRYFQKFRDKVEIIASDTSLNPFILESESGIKLHEVGGGLRYDTVEPWIRGDAPKPMEVHLRFLHAIEGSGSHAPKWTRVEAGIRLFRRLWGQTK